MKKWIIIIILVLIILFTGAGVYAYQLIREPLLHELNQAESYVKGQKLLTEVTSASYYHGTDAFYVLIGSTEEGSEAIVWVSEDYDFHHVELQTDGLSKEDALAIVHQEDNIKGIQSVKLGFERGLPVYEITYLNEENRKGYYYLTFADGTFMKRYVLRTN
ncbi:cell wall elongation regulator TseB-like domain-containing protein [Halalkalibacter akibai]|uniref:Cell wall elongation regulator TseB-like domain-containing protein n=1 Tax=Halalkalibacter akibai (strain ATCC 43226 / DSM 21942 / CIP 109018 / JCM 9157 / 1139) TaxID=1236973 RepID=W4QTE9_HALA3|nr:DUF5590 domain-containing protein [Halalkalibacter akibai]GAE34594.1 hypothetical protein JCM9157_1663 [Halalkalibacter akibai JCM 9157]